MPERLPLLSGRENPSLRSKWLTAMLAAFAFVRPAGAREATPMASTTLGRVALSWSAPGDDYHVGRAAGYDLRYAIYPIDANNFRYATQATGLSTPRLAGEQEFFTVEGLLPHTLYYFAIKTVDEAGNWSAMSNVVQEFSHATVSTDPEILPLDLSIPYPNPARSTTRLELSLPQDTHVRVDVYDVSGRRIRTLADGLLGLGRRTLEWDLAASDGGRVRPGVYMIIGQLGGERFKRRIVVTR